MFYALGFSTNLYALSYHMDESSSLFYVSGAELYREVQPFNRAFFMRTVIYMLACVALFITLTHRRRLYYLSNYVTSLVFAGFSVYMGADILTHALEYKALYLTVDFEKLKVIAEMMNMRYVESTFFLDLGIAISFILFALALGLVVNLIMKTIWMRREKWSGEVLA